MARASSDDVIGVLASGGLDSCILTSELLRQGRTVQPIFVRSGLVWEQMEILALRRYLAREKSPALRELVVLHLPVKDLYGRHWSLTGLDTPPSESPDDEVFLPGRNALLVFSASIWCQLNGVSELTLATLTTSPFADARRPFFDHAQAILDCYDRFSVRITIPFGDMTKQQVMELGRNRPLEVTFSCISPAMDRHCGRCNKCAERQKAFRDSGVPDRTPYAHQKNSPAELRRRSAGL
jgi:7-cyano-7-deazaguanine synthase